MTGVIESKWIL